MGESRSEEGKWREWNRKEEIEMERKIKIDRARKRHNIYWKGNKAKRRQKGMSDKEISEKERYKKKMACREWKKEGKVQENI